MLHVILDLDLINQSSRQVHHNRLWARARPWSGHRFRQLSRDNSGIANLHTSEAAGSRMRYEIIRDQDTLRTQDNDSTMQRTETPPLDKISLYRLEDCNGCNGRNGHNGYDGRIVQFYGYTRLQQPNDTSTGHVRDEHGEQFGRSLGQHHVNTLGGHRVNTLGEHCFNTLGGARINTLGGVWVEIGISRWVRVNIGIIRMCSKRFRNRSTGSQPSRLTYSMVWIVYKKWAGNGPRILGRCQQIEAPWERSGWSATVRWV